MTRARTAWQVLASLWAVLAASAWAQDAPPAKTAPAAASAAPRQPAASATAPAAGPAGARVAEPPTTVTAAQLPALKPGLWEYHRTVTNSRNPTKPQTSSVQKCADPMREYQDKLAQLAQRGCRFSPLKRDGSDYHSSWSCPGPDGLISFEDVLTVHNELSYQAQSTIRYVPQSSRDSSSLIKATWLGNCPLVGKPPAN